jgi:membrane protease YdiL (CAAX protease family)
MLVSLSYKLIIMVFISVFLLCKSENSAITIFEPQNWSILQILPIYWIYAVLSLISVFVYPSLFSKGYYQIPIPVAIFSVVILFAIIRHFAEKKSGFLKLVCLNKTHIYYFIAFILLQFVAVGTLLYKNNIDLTRITYILSFSSVVVVFAPIIEEVYFKGMLFIPTCRKAGIFFGALLISSLQTLVHFTSTLPQLLVIFFILGLLGSYLFIRTRKIIAPLFLHSTFNFIVLMREINRFLV